MRERKGSLSVQNSIQTRLSFVMALVMVFVVCINFFIFEQIHTGVDRIDAVFSSNAAINDLSDTLNNLEGTVYEYLNIKGTKALENYYRYEQDYRELLDKLNDRNVDNEVKMLEKTSAECQKAIWIRPARLFRPSEEEILRSTRLLMKKSCSFMNISILIFTS